MLVTFQNSSEISNWLTNMLLNLNQSNPVVLPMKTIFLMFLLSLSRTICYVNTKNVANQNLLCCFWRKIKFLEKPLALLKDLLELNSMKSCDLNFAVEN